MKFSLSWKGLSEVDRSLEDLQVEIQKARHEALKVYGEDATTNMKDRHDADAHDIRRYVNRTWYLTNSITFDLQLMSDKTERLRIFTPAFYASMVENGTARSRPYPFFWVEVYGLEPEAVARLYRLFLKALSDHQRVYVDTYGRFTTVTRPHIVQGEV